MESSVAAQILAQSLREDRLIALVGSGASAMAKDKYRDYRGLPTPSEFVESISHRYSYILPSMTFTDACDTLYKYERRAGLEDALLRYYRIPSTFEIPPAHRILSWLPFSLYITSNYDQFIERAINDENRHFQVIIENQDVIRLRRGYLPVVKYHGCVSRPSSMLATFSDYSRLENERVLVRELISVSLASRTLLVIGHGLNDSDLSTLLSSLLEQLRDYAPSIFIVREPGHTSSLPNFDFPYEIILEDLTQFLNRILHEYRQQSLSLSGSFLDETWLRSAFFATLRQAAVLPSETQVIDAFLSHLAEELGARSNEVESVLLDANAAVEGALNERPNYTALRRTWAQMTDNLNATNRNLGAVETVVRNLISERENKKGAFRTIGREVINANERILIYSQSQRVLQALEGVPQAIQRTCEIFVAECRPKSPNAYQDAIAISRSLTHSFYAITMCPDVVAINLIANGQITKIIMGTHAIYVDETNNPYAFINTCGTLAVSLAAERYKVPLLVIGEVLKVEFVPPQDAVDHIFAHQENDLLEGQIGVTELSTQRKTVSHTNIGYDLVPMTPLTTIYVPDGQSPISWVGIDTSAKLESVSYVPLDEQPITVIKRQVKRKPFWKWW